MIERCALQYLIEVKSGVNSKLRSLHQYMDRTPHDIAIRVWTERFSIDNVTTPNGKAFRLVNIPFYYVGQIDKILLNLRNLVFLFKAFRPLSLAFSQLL